MTPIWRQAGQSFETGLAGFLTAPGRALDDNNDKAWMFDNKIDWVKRIESVPAQVGRREAFGFWAKIALNVALIQGRAQAMSYCKLMTQASVQVRRVSLGVQLDRA